MSAEGATSRRSTIRSRVGSRSTWRWVRRLLAVALLVFALVAAWDRRTELHHALNQLGHPAWVWLIAAVAAQSSSMVAFARVQRWLLRAGGVNVRLRDMVEITVAGNALGTSLPGGAAWAAGWAWGQLRRRNVDRILAGWVLLVAGALSSFAIFLLVVVGAEIAGGRGPVAQLRWVSRSLLGLACVIAVGAISVRRSQRVQAKWLAFRQLTLDHGGRRAAVMRFLATMGPRLRVVRPSPWAWVEALGLALYNWVADLLTLIFCVWTIHASVPWRGIVVSYALTQISASIPITPGGLAVVEASLTALLTAYGMPATSAVTVVLLYRIISFWILVPVGWAAWGYLELAQRRAVGADAGTEASRPLRRHPWAFHRHGAAHGAVPPALGPERVMPPAPCEGCDEPQGEPGEPVAASRRER